MLIMMENPKGDGKQRCQLLMYILREDGKQGTRSVKEVVLTIWLGSHLDMAQKQRLRELGYMQLLGKYNTKGMCLP